MGKHQQHDLRKLLAHAAPTSSLLGKHYAESAIALGAFLSLFTPAPVWFRCLRGVPEGAIMVRFKVDEAQGVLYILWEHPSFAAIGFSGQVPRVAVEFAAWNEAAARAEASHAAEQARAMTSDADPDACDPSLLERAARP